MKWLATFLVLISASAWADPELISRLHEAERARALPPNTLVALAQTESTLSWFALNIDGASFYPDTKSAALLTLKNVSARPYVINVQSREGGPGELYFFQTEQSAARTIDRLKVYQYPRALPFKEAGNKLVRKLNLHNTGMCALQINYRWHARDQGRSAAQLLDPAFCIEYAADFLATLVTEHGFERGVGCYYTCGSSKRAQRDRKEYFERYSRNLRRLNFNSGIARN